VNAYHYRYQLILVVLGTIIVHFAYRLRQRSDTTLFFWSQFIMGDCPVDNDYDGRMGVRISSIFVIGICSILGALALAT
jgi:hypothetical protein